MKTTHLIIWILAVTSIIVLKNPVINMFAFAIIIYIALDMIFNMYSQHEKYVKLSPNNDNCTKKKHTRNPCGNLGNCDDNCNVPFPFDCDLPNPGYKQELWSILDAVPPPDHDHKYKEDTFSREPLCLTDKNGRKIEIDDYDRWRAVWKPNSDYSAKYLSWSNDFLL